MNKKNSLLLPPQFFETDSDKKIRTILDLGVDALYLFDHFKNPTDSIKPTYIFTEEIFSLYKKVKNEIEVGVCVLNVNASKNSFHAARKLNNPVTATAGKERGKTTLVKIWN